MNEMVHRENVVNALTMKNKKGCKAILEMIIVKQTIIVVLIEFSLITETRIASNDVGEMTFRGRIDGHGQMRK